MGYVANFVCKHFEHRLRFDKVTDSYKVGTFFLRHSVVNLNMASEEHSAAH